jgi:hypothetical protein
MAVADSCCWCRRVGAVRRWRLRYVAKGVDGLLKDATRAQAADGEENQASREPDAQREATGRHPLERAHDRGAGWHRAVFGTQDLGSPRPQATSDETFKLSRDPNFVATVDESLVQALDRTQPGLPMKKGR